MIRHASSWGALLAVSSGLFALQCSLEGLGDGVRPSSQVDAGDAANDAKAPEAVFISGLPAPDELAIAPDFLYFTTARNGGMVERCPIRGCNGAPEPVSTAGQENPRGLSVGPSVVVGWANFDSGDVMIASLGTGASHWQERPIARGQLSPAGMAVRENDVAVWTNSAAPTGTPVVANRIGMGAPIIALSRKAVKPGPIIVPRETKDVVWGDANGLSETTLGGDGTDGSGACTFVASDAGVQSLVSSDSDPLALYWATSDGRILQTHRPDALDALQNCRQSTVETMASGQGVIASVALDGAFVYFTVSNGEKGSLRRIQRSGTDVETLLDDLNDPRGIVVDDAYVYVVVRGDGTIRRLVRYGT
ncbi:hypothetical protein LVJ94_43310 [Pendulispora rubella]|uniref:Uncharacterized protein n=1 Tax=Pendulispora rubella TaxID=2741070 RepID=A0ABZ2KYZ8_9BACT